MLESKLQSKAIEIARSRGWWCEKIVSQSGRGIMDLLAIRAGVHLFIEMKQEDEDLRRQQEVRASELRRHGATVIKVDTIEDARKVFK